MPGATTLLTRARYARGTQDPPRTHPTKVVDKRPAGATTLLAPCGAAARGTRDSPRERALQGRHKERNGRVFVAPLQGATIFCTPIPRAALPHGANNVFAPAGRNMAYKTQLLIINEKTWDNSGPRHLQRFHPSQTLIFREVELH